MSDAKEAPRRLDHRHCELVCCLTPKAKDTNSPVPPECDVTDVSVSDDGDVTCVAVGTETLN